MISVDNISYSYGEHIALDDISIEFKPYQISAVLGESGSGKTTLLRCLGRFLRPETGKMRFNEESFDEISEAEFRQKIGLVFQQLNLFPHLTVMQNMTLALRKVRMMAPGNADREALGMLERLKIADLAEKYPSQISGGQAQRVAIARGLVLKPDFMLLDEPTSALDANTTDDFAEWLLELRDTTDFIIVTHDTIFAQKVASHGVYLSNGKILDTGKVETIIEHVKAGALS